MPFALWHNHFNVLTITGTALSILLLSSLVTLAGSGGASVSALNNTTGVIVPLYTYPTSSTWNTMVKVKTDYPSVPTIVIINPASGPGSSKDSNYSDGIKKLQAAGISVLGYVHTSYSSKTASAVKADIDKYRSYYPSIDGIFFDEMAN